MRGRTGSWGPALVATLTMGCDLGLTGWYRSVQPVTWILNHGIGFGLMAHSPWLTDFSVAMGLAALLVGYRFWPIARYPLAVIGGGALANLVSRLLYGGVVDYWHWPPYPYTFNMADIAIRAGLVYLMLSTWIMRRQHSVSKNAHTRISNKRGTQ